MIFFVNIQCANYTNEVSLLIIIILVYFVRFFFYL